MEYPPDKRVTVVTLVELLVVAVVMFGTKMQSTGMLGSKVRVKTESSGRVKTDLSGIFLSGRREVTRVF